MQSGKLNNTRCDDLGKLMKQSSFKVKKPAEGGGGGEDDPKGTIHYIK